MSMMLKRMLKGKWLCIIIGIKLNYLPGGKVGFYENVEKIISVRVSSNHVIIISGMWGKGNNR